MRYAIAFAFLIAQTPLARTADWQAVTTELLKKEKPGYGGLSGVAVDHSTGHVYIQVSDRGVFRSTDQGKTWERHGHNDAKGRTETPACLQLDPTGKSKRIIMPTVYGGPIAVGSIDKPEWRTLDKASVHVDWCAADWSDPDLKFILALKHEAGGLLLRSRDGGKTFDDVGKGHGPAWVFDADTAVVTLAKSKDRPKGGLVRTTDGGRTFKPVGEYAPVSLPRLHDGVLYWLADGALIKTADKGESWQKVCDFKEARVGPVFGKSAKHMFVLTGTSVMKTTDGGMSWERVEAIPKELKGVSPLTWLEYDPINDVVYVMKMTSELFKLPRGAK